ncbi:MAG: DUF58 domain-containing protein [Lachnospiraceae bacterium]|nr:DUF58 domain-containing protein [Lachnospiraceae bacterium]
MILNWLFYIVAMGMLSIGAAIFAQRIFVVLFIFGLMVPIVSLFVMLFLRGRFLATLHSDTEMCHAGERFRFHVLVTNHGWMPCWHVEITVTNEDVLFLDGRRMKTDTAILGKSQTRCDMSMDVSHCGRLQLTLRSVLLVSPFGLFSTHAKIQNAVSVFDVYPDEVELTGSPLRENPYAYIADEEYSTSRPGDDPSELFGVREYRPGDRQNRIHWNLTASRDTLIVKELGLPIDTSTVLLVDFYELPRKDGEELYNTLMTTVSGLARGLIDRRKIFYISWINDSGNAWRNRIETEEEYLAALTQMFEIRPYAKTTSVTEQYASRFASERYRNILYVTTEIADTANEGITKMRHESNVTIYEIVPKTETGGVRTREDDVRVQSIRVNHVRDDINAE